MQGSIQLMIGIPVCVRIRWRRRSQTRTAVPEPRPEPAEHPKLVEFEAAHAAAAFLYPGKRETEWKVGDGRIATTDRR